MKTEFIGSQQAHGRGNPWKAHSSLARVYMPRPSQNNFCLLLQTDVQPCRRQTRCWGSRRTGSKNFQADVWERTWERQEVRCPWSVTGTHPGRELQVLSPASFLWSRTGIYCCYPLLVQLPPATTVHKRPRPHQDPQIPPMLLWSRWPNGSAHCCLQVCHFCTTGPGRLSNSRQAHRSQGILGTPTLKTGARHILELLPFLPQLPPIPFLVFADNTCSDKKGNFHSDSLNNVSLNWLWFHRAYLLLSLLSFWNISTREVVYVRIVNFTSTHAKSRRLVFALMGQLRSPSDVNN